jgi:NADH dehydrogenase FAD-containing subunit
MVIERRVVMTQPSTRILVLGGGIAGLLFTLRLSGKVAHESVQITLVNESDIFTIRPWLHEFATDQRVFDRMLPQILRKAPVQFLQGRVTGIDPEQRRVTIRDQQQRQQELSYDCLVYALGSTPERQNVPGVAQYAYSLEARGPLSASALREKLPELRANGGRVVVCGAGATGIETAAQVASIYPEIKVSLVTRGAFAHAWEEKVADIFQQRLAKLGVEIVDQSEVMEVRPQSVVLDRGRELPCSLCIWTTGFVAPPLAREAGLSVNERGQILVDPFLRSVSHPQVYAIGDAAMPVRNPGVPHVRMSAYTASIMAAHAADSLSDVLKGVTPKPLSFAYQAQAVALGRGSALFLPLSAEDKPVSPYFAGRTGAFVREAFVRFVIRATMSQQRFPGMFMWFGKDRYEQQLARSASVEDASLSSAHSK